MHHRGDTPDTLRHKVAKKTRTSAQTRRPRHPPPSFSAAFLRSRQPGKAADAQRPKPRLPGGPVNGAGEGEGIGRDRAHSMMHGTPTARLMASPGALCTRSVLGAPGLGSGAGVGAPCSIPVTLSTRSVTKSQRRPGRAPRPAGAPHPPPPQRCYQADRQPKLPPLNEPAGRESTATEQASRHRQRHRDSRTKRARP